MSQIELENDMEFYTSHIERIAQHNTKSIPEIMASYADNGAQIPQSIKTELDGLMAELSQAHSENNAAKPLQVLEQIKHLAAKIAGLGSDFKN